MDTSRGGRETSTAQIAQELARRGHEVTILCQAGSWNCEGVRVHALGRRGVLKAQRLNGFVRDVRTEIARGSYDVVHAMLPVPGADVYQPRGGTVPGQRAAGARRRPIFGLLGDPLNWRRRAMARLEREVMIDERVHCLAVSYMVAGEIESCYGRTERVRVVYNAVDVPDPDGPQRAEWRRQRRQQLGIGEDTTVFLTVATNFELKGVLETIFAFAKWLKQTKRRADARLVCIGRDEPEGYQRMAVLRDIGNHTVFLPPTDEIFQWYSAADACVLLSWYDPCSRVILEATRWGIPSITTVYNGAAEILGEGGGIVVSSPKDYRAITGAMAALADPEHRRARSQACLAAAESLTIARHVDELLEVYSQVCSNRGAGPRQ